jgi:rhodanese-related sulfurtransferase
VVTCRVGQRGHTAASLLSEREIEVKNLDGGYLTWLAAEAARTGDMTGVRNLLG